MNNLPPGANDAVITTAEAAKIQGKSVTTINRMAEDGTLPTAFKAPGLRGARFFRRTDVEALQHIGKPDTAEQARTAS